MLLPSNVFEPSSVMAQAPNTCFQINDHIWNYVIGEDCVEAKYHCWVQVNLIEFYYSLATLVASSPTPSGMIFVLFRLLDLA